MLSCFGTAAGTMDSGVITRAANPTHALAHVAGGRAPDD